MKTLLLGTLMLTGLVLAGGNDANEALADAARKGDVAGVNKALEAGADVNATDKDGGTALDGAFLSPEVTNLLLEKGADPNKGSYPALISAANCYSLEVMKLLLDAGADPNKVGKKMVDPGAGIRALIDTEKAKGKKANKDMIKAWEGMVKTMKPTEIKANALQQTVQQTNCVKCLELLFEKGAVQDKATDGTLIHTLSAFAMSQQQRKEAFKLGAPAMESYGVKVPEWYTNLPNDLNGTSVEILNVLVANGIEINKKNAHGQRPLEIAKALVSGATTAEAKANKEALVEAIKGHGGK